MSYFFSSQRREIIAPTMGISHDDEEDDGGVVIVEANTDLAHDNLPRLPANRSESNLNLLSKMESSRAPQIVDDSLPLDQINLSQSDLICLDELFNINDAPKIICLDEPIPTRHDDATCLEQFQSPTGNVGTGESDEFPRLEVLEHIGTFLMMQHLESDSLQGDKSGANHEKLTGQSGEWNRLLMLAQTLYWIFCSIPFKILHGMVCGVWLAMSVLARVWNWVWISCYVISFALKSMSAFFICTRNLGGHVFQHAKTSLLAKTGRSSTVVAFWAGVATHVVFGAALSLLKLGTLTALQMISKNFATETTRVITRIVVRIGVILRRKKSPTKKPKSSGPFGSSVDELLLHVYNESDGPEIVILEPHISKLYGGEAFAHRIISRVTNDATFDSQNTTYPDCQSRCILAASQNSSLTHQESFSRHGFAVNMIADSDHITAIMNFTFLLIMAFVYVWLPRKCFSNPASAIAMSKRHFTGFSRASLETECRKRGLKAPALRQDKLRHLCKHDGVKNLFPERNLLNYSDLSKDQLKVALKELGEYSSGNKEDLQYRLLMARERMYEKLTQKELKLISQKVDLKVNDMALVRCLAEAGPALPLEAHDIIMDSK